MGIGELKEGDILIDKRNNKICTVENIEYHRTIDDEQEEITVRYENNNSAYFVLPDKLANETYERYKGKKNIKEKEMKQKIEAGDYVRVKCGKDTEKEYGIISNMRDMEKEKKLKIQSVSSYDSNLIRVYEKNEHTIWNFHINDVTLVEKANKKGKKEKSEMKNNKYTVIFNGPATILFVDRMIGCEKEKYVTKAYNEEFDAEKGLALALLKSFGISYLDLKRMLKNAKYQNKKEQSPKEKFEELSNQIKVTKEMYFKEPTRNPDIPKVKIEYRVVSPKGRHRGKPFAFQIGDKVVVRDCDYYKYITNSSAKTCLNQVFEITEDKSDFSGSMYLVNGCEFSGAELEPVVK